MNGQAAATLTASSATNPAVAGKYATLTATVAGAGQTPTGTATFAVNGSPALCVGGATQSLSSGQATCLWRPSAAGSDTVTFTYSGDQTYAAAGPSVGTRSPSTGRSPPPRPSPRW